VFLVWFLLPEDADRAGPTTPGGSPPASARAATREAGPSPQGGRSPSGEVRTFISRGGTIEARCTAVGEAKLVTWAAKPPYQVERVNPEPVPTAVIVFRHAASRIRTAVTCAAGSPTVVTLPL
jgi:hypothetical protein